MKIFFINLCDLFHSHHTFAVDNGHMKFLFQIFIDGMSGNLGSKAGNRFFQKIVMVDDQRNIIQIVDTLDIVNFSSDRKAGVRGLFFTDAQFSEKNNFRAGILAVPCSRFIECFDLTDGEGSLLTWTVDIADTFSLHGLYIAVTDKKANCAAQSISGAAVGLDQGVFRGKKLLVGKSVIFDFHFQIFIDIFINTSWHFYSPFMFGQKI